MAKKLEMLRSYPYCKFNMWRDMTHTSGVVEKEGIFELRYKLTTPKKCGVDTCKGFKFKHLQGEHMRCSDYQEIKIQVGRSGCLSAGDEDCGIYISLEFVHLQIMLMLLLSV